LPIYPGMLIGLSVTSVATSLPPAVKFIMSRYKGFHSSYTNYQYCNYGLTNCQEMKVLSTFF